MLTYDRDAGLYVPRPGYELNGARIHIKINSLGFRGDEITRDKPPHTVRIACLGASTTFGAESSSNHTTWPHRLQEKLQTAYPHVHVEVINASVGGYTSTECLTVLRRRVLPLRPDLVIYYEANNEIVKDTREFAKQQGILTETGGGSPAARAISKYSLLFDLLYKNATILAGERGRSGPKIDRIPHDLPEHFIGAIDSMHQDLSLAHVPMLLSTFLVKYRRNQPRDAQIRNADVAFYYMPWMSIDGLLDAMDVYNDAILSYGRAHGVPVVDDRDAIPADSTHYADCMHFTDGGSEAMADRFYRFLLASGLFSRA